MVVTAGQLVFIKLDHFKPLWRQAVVLSEKGRFFVLAVRVTSGETNEEAARLFSHYECEGCHFMLQGQYSRGPFLAAMFLLVFWILFWEP